MEDFNTTLSLFNAALQIPGADWHKMFKNVGGHAKNEVVMTSDMKKNRDDVLAKAWSDPELQRYMRLDLQLYEHAVDVFHQQAKSHGLL